MRLHLKPASPSDYLHVRSGEIHIGQTVNFLKNIPDNSNELKNIINQNADVKYLLLFISEDVGPRANLGKYGAVNGPESFKKGFYNIQHHDRKNSSLNHDEFIDGKEFLVVGDIDLADIQEQSTGLDNQKDNEKFSDLLEQMSGRAQPVINACAGSKASTIVIGGGDNWGFECIKSIYEATAKKVVIINFDPHSDTRDFNGRRHSGNWMTLAYNENLVEQYFPIGLDFIYNNDFIVDFLIKKEVPFDQFTKNRIRREGIESIAIKVADYINNHYPDSPIFLNFDCDSVAGLPLSARNPDGLSMHQAYLGVEFLLSSLRHKPKILRISELGPDKNDHMEMRTSGRFSIRLVSIFTSAC